MSARTIEVAEVPLRFCGDERAMALIERRYGAFLIAHAAADATEIELCLRPPRAVCPPPEDLDVVARAGTISFTGAGLVAEVAADLSAARITAALAERPVDAVVRFVLASRLLERGGLLVHASAVKIGACAWVFAGPSGVGKSTLGAELRGELLCDEAVALRPRNGGVVAFATPYWRARPGCAPVAGVVFPARSRPAGQAPEWQPMTPSRAAAQLVASTGPLLPNAAGAALHAAAHLASAVACTRATLSTIGEIRGWLQPLLATMPPARTSNAVGAHAQ